MSIRNNVYANCNPDLLKLFASAGHPAKVMCVALDYAKAEHRALICNGTGELCKGSFAVENSAEGVKKLLEEVQAQARRRRIRPEHVFFGGEDYPSFAENFLRQLRAEKYLVVRVNAWEAKQYRDNFQASSDSLDLLGIARCCLNRRGQAVREPAPAYANLRAAARQRDDLVWDRTATSNRIYPYVDRLLPGFLNARQSGIAPFSEASLALIEEGLSAERIAKKPLAKLAQWLARRGVDQPRERADQLKALARAALPPEKEQAAILQSLAAKLVKLYRGLDESIAALDRELAFWLAQTPGALLTSISGFGVTLAAGWMAELGPPGNWRAVRRTCSYAGVIPSSKQTGGAAKAPVEGHPQNRCNKRLKNVVLQAVEKVRQFGPPELAGQYAPLDARGAHTERLMAKRLIRLCKCIVLSGAPYRPKTLLEEQAPPQSVAAHYEQLWEKLVLKWKNKACLDQVFDPKNPLGAWRAMAQQLYALELRLPRKKGQPKPAAQTP